MGTHSSSRQQYFADFFGQGAGLVVPRRITMASMPIFLFARRASLAAAVGLTRVDAVKRAASLILLGRRHGLLIMRVARAIRCIFTAIILPQYLASHGR